jgi:hypothetical protein
VNGALPLDREAVGLLIGEPAAILMPEIGGLETDLALARPGLEARAETCAIGAGLRGAPLVQPL